VLTDLLIPYYHAHNEDASTKKWMLNKADSFRQQHLFITTKVYNYIYHNYKHNYICNITLTATVGNVILLKKWYLFS
jgi:hypothetical protein